MKKGLSLSFRRSRSLFFRKQGKEYCFHLAQYAYSVDSYLSDPTAVHWLVSEESDSDVRLTFRGRKPLATYLRGYENDDLTFEIKIPEVEPIPLPEIPPPNRKKQKVSRKSRLEYELHRSRVSDETIKIRLFPLKESFAVKAVADRKIVYAPNYGVWSYRGD